MTPLQDTPPALRAQGLALWTAVAVLAMAVPWLNPVTWGPNPEMVQRLLSVGCGAVLLVAWVGVGPRVSARALAHTLAWGWLLAALLSAGAGVLQYFGAEGLVPYPWINASTPGQAYANLRQRNQFASLTSLGLVALLYLAAEAPHAAARQATLRRGCLVLAIAVLALGNAASSSRTGVLQWLGLVVLAWVWARHGRRSMLGGPCWQPPCMCWRPGYFLWSWKLPPGRWVKARCSGFRRALAAAAARFCGAMCWS